MRADPIEQVAIPKDRSGSFERGRLLGELALGGRPVCRFGFAQEYIPVN
jgi:hypothetical protein